MYEHVQKKPDSLSHWTQKHSALNVASTMPQVGIKKMHAVRNFRDQHKMDQMINTNVKQIGGRPSWIKSANERQ